MACSIQYYRGRVRRLASALFLVFDVLSRKQTNCHLLYDPFVMHVLIKIVLWLTAPSSECPRKADRIRYDVIKYSGNPVSVVNEDCKAGIMWAAPVLINGEKMRHRK